MLMNVLPWAFGGLLLAMLLNFWRLLRGPDAVDRALALAARVGHNKAAIALANKTARRLWAAEHHRTSFDPDHVSAAPLAPH